LLIAISIAGLFFGEQAARHQLHEQIARTVGAPAAGALEKLLENAHRSGAGIIGTVLGVVVFLFGAAGVFGELQDSLNTIWEVKPKPGQGLRGIVRNRLFSFSVVLGTGFLLLVSLVASAVLSGLEGAVRDRLAGGEVLWRAVNFVVSFGLVALLFAMIYKLLPDADVNLRDVWVGAAITAPLFAPGKYLIGLNLAKGAIASSYGAAGSVIIVLVWVYYSSRILLFGAEFTRVYAPHTGSAIRPDEHSESVNLEDRTGQGMVSPDELKAAARARSHPGPGNGQQ
jgi:membrane protein